MFSFTSLHRTLSLPSRFGLPDPHFKLPPTYTQDAFPYRLLHLTPIPLLHPATQDSGPHSTPPDNLVYTDPAGVASTLTSSNCLGALATLFPVIYATTPSPKATLQIKVNAASEGPCQHGFVAKLTIPKIPNLIEKGDNVFEGECMPSKREAKRQLALKVCHALHATGVFTRLLETGISTPTIHDPALKDIKDLPSSVTLSAPCPFGDLWDVNSEVWLHKVRLELPASRITHVVGIICGKQLSGQSRNFERKINGFALQFSIEESCKLTWSEKTKSSRLSRLDHFHRLVLHVMVNRKHSSKKYVYMLAPLRVGSLQIDWNQVDNPLQELTKRSDIKNFTHLIAPFELLHSRLFQFDRDGPTLELSSKFQDNAQTLNPAFFESMSKFNSVEHFYTSTFKVTQSDLTSPLLYLKSVFLMKDGYMQLNSEALEATEYKDQILLPWQSLKGSKLSLSFWQCAAFLPFIIRAIHDEAQALALLSRCDIVSLDLSTNPVITALTPHGILHSESEFNLEALEAVGHAFLKAASSVHLYLLHPHKGEGALTELRSKKTSKACLRVGLFSSGLAGHVLNQPFRLGDLYGPVYGDESSETLQKRNIDRAVLSSITEALFGVAYLSRGLEAALKIGSCLGLCLGGSVTWTNRSAKAVELDEAQKSTPSKKKKASSTAHGHLQVRLDYQFDRLHYLSCALRHRSAARKNYERDEWLGDALLDLWALSRLQAALPSLDSHSLTSIGSHLVSNAALAALAHEKLLLHDGLVEHQTGLLHPKDVVDEIKKTKGSSVSVAFIPQGEKIWADVVEAIVGAVFVDCGLNLDRTFKMLDRIFEEKMDHAIKNADTLVKRSAKTVTPFA